MSTAAYAPAQRLLRRCAWCGRYAVDGGWQYVDWLNRPTAQPAASGAICPDCERRLRDRQLSR